MGQGHGHGHGHIPVEPVGGARYARRLAIAFGIALGYFVVEAVFALITGSLTLLADAGHMLTDTIGLGLALGAITLAARSQRRGRRTFGLYRLEVLAALANATLLFTVSVYVLWHAIQRMNEPVDLPTHQMLFVGVIGLIANLACFLMLAEGAKENLNVRGAYLEVVADAIGSVAVIIAALLILRTGWGWVDPAFAIALAAFIVPRTVRLASQAIGVLLQSAPAHVDMAAVEADLVALAGVTAVHDLHIWTLSSSMDVATAHLQLGPDAEPADVLAAAQALLRDKYRVEHATLQLEPAGVLVAGRARWCAAKISAATPSPATPSPAAPVNGHGGHDHGGHDGGHDHGGHDHGDRPALEPTATLAERIVPLGRGRHRRS